MRADDLDNTANCPPGERCERCSSADGLEVMTADTRSACSAPPSAPLVLRLAVTFRAWTYPTAVVRALEHCEHLGIDADSWPSPGTRRTGSRPPGRHSPTHEPRPCSNHRAGRGSLVFGRNWPTPGPPEAQERVFGRSGDR